MRRTYCVGPPGTPKPPKLPRLDQNKYYMFFDQSLLWSRESQCDGQDRRHVEHVVDLSSNKLNLIKL